LAVTVVAGDSAGAEVLSKTLFLHGADRVAIEAERQRVAALWIDDRGTVGESRAMAPHVVWRAP
jgi:thiamine biosynthesis lipoprotein